MTDMRLADEASGDESARLASWRLLLGNPVTTISAVVLVGIVVGGGAPRGGGAGGPPTQE
jgi:hypothetical protein